MLIHISAGGVNLTSLHPSMRKVFKATTKVWNNESYGEPVITETWGGRHSAGSFHPFGRALDFRLPVKNKVILKSLVKELRTKLGEDYDVVLESTHIHIEYDPKENK